MSVGFTDLNLNCKFFAQGDFVSFRNRNSAVFDLDAFFLVESILSSALSNVARKFRKGSFSAYSFARSIAGGSVFDDDAVNFHLI